MHGKPVWEILLSVKEGYPGVDEIRKQTAGLHLYTDPGHDSGLGAGKGHLAH